MLDRDVLGAPLALVGVLAAYSVLLQTRRRYSQALVVAAAMAVVLNLLVLILAIALIISGP